MHERETGQDEQPTQWTDAHDNPALWIGGETFSVVLREEKRDGKTLLDVEISDGKEIVLVQFTNSVRSASTLFLPAETTPLEQTHETVSSSAAPATPPQTLEAPTAVSGQETNEKKPTKIVGNVQATSTLDKTKKQGKDVLRFTVFDTQNEVERNIVAFEAVAIGLAHPETHFAAGQPITVFAWKHDNEVHIRGQKRTIEEWYAQRVLYAGKTFAKPRKKRER